MRHVVDEVLHQLSERKYSSIFQEHQRWIEVVDNCAKRYNVKWLVAAEAVVDALRKAPEQASTAEPKQARSEELWEDFAMLHWGYFNWYTSEKEYQDKIESNKIFAKLKEMDNEIAEFNHSTGHESLINSCDTVEEYQRALEELEGPIFKNPNEDKS